MQTGNTKTIFQVKEEIYSIVSKLHCVNDCIVEFNDNLNANKIVVTINDTTVLKELKDLLSRYTKYGYKIVIRESPKSPFVFY